MARLRPDFAALLRVDLQRACPTGAADAAPVGTRAASGEGDLRGRQLGGMDLVRGRDGNDAGLRCAADDVVRPELFDYREAHGYGAGRVSGARLDPGLIAVSGDGVGALVGTLGHDVDLAGRVTLADDLHSLRVLQPVCRREGDSLHRS